MRLAFNEHCGDNEVTNESDDDGGEEGFGRCLLRGRGLSSSSTSSIMAKSETVTVTVLCTKHTCDTTRFWQSLLVNRKYIILYYII